MAYVELTTYNITGPQVLFCYANDITLGIAMYMFYVSVFLIMAFSITEYQRRSTGYTDFSVGFGVASFTTLVLGILFRLIDCGTNPLTSNLALAVLIVLAMIGIIFLLNDRGR